MSPRPHTTSTLRRLPLLLALTLACDPGSDPVVPNVLDPALIELADSAVSFKVMEADPNPDPITIAIANGGEAELTGLSVEVEYLSGHSEGWLDVTVATGASTVLRVEAKTEALFPGAYEATVQVMAEGAANSPRQVAVSLHVEALPDPARIRYDRGSVEFDVALGAEGASERVMITNAGERPLIDLSARVVHLSGADWIEAELDSAAAPTGLTVTARTAHLDAGSYHGRVDLSSDSASNGNVSVSVRLLVRDTRPTIELSPAERHLTGYEGSEHAAASYIRVTNGGEGSLGEVSFGVNYAQGQPTGWLAATSHSSEAPFTIDLQPSAGNLTAGIYEAYVVVSSPDASNGADSVYVRFDVAPPGPIIALSDSSVRFNAEQHGASPPPRLVTITNIGEGTLTDLELDTTHVALDGSWLRASLDRTTAPAVLSLTVLPGGLAEGLHQTRLSIGSPVAQNEYGYVGLGVSVVISPGLPDYQLEVNWNIPDTARAGDRLAVPSYLERNSGTGWGGGHHVGFYLSTDADVTTDDLLVERRSYHGLDAGEERALPGGGFELPAGVPPGDYHLGVIIDIDQVVHESDEANNVSATMPLTVHPFVNRYSLSVGSSPTEGGWIDVQPHLLEYDEGTVVTLTAHPRQSWGFGGWGGDLSGSGLVVQIVMDGDKSVSATFERLPPELRPFGDLARVVLSWNYTWPCIADADGRCIRSPEDRVEIEESTTGDASDFVSVYLSDETRPTAGTVILPRDPGTYYYRVRGYGPGWSTDYSSVLAATVR